MKGGNMSLSLSKTRDLLKKKIPPDYIISHRGKVFVAIGEILLPVEDFLGNTTTKLGS